MKKVVIFSIFINLLVIYYFLGKYNYGYNFLDKMDGAIFALNFGFGIPIVLSIFLIFILTLLFSFIMIVPGILIYLLCKYFFY